MKKSLLVLITLSLSFSCSNLIEEEIFGTISDDLFWNTEEDLRAGTSSAYTQLGTAFRAFSLWQYAIEDLSTDYGAGGYRDTYPFSQYTGWSATQPQAMDWGIWRFLWKSISLSNKVIEEAPGVPIDQSIKDQYTGEAKALRSLVYYYLVNWFGGVPIITSTTDTRTSIPRNSVEETYTFIENDLLEAIELMIPKSELMETTNEYGRVTKGGAQALLAKVYLQQKKYQEASDICQQIISSGEYQLENNYADIFSLSNEGFQNLEVIWSLAFIGNGSQGEVNGHVLFPYLFRPAEFDPYAAYNDWDGDMSVSNEFFDSFDPNDVRRELLVKEALVEGNPMTFEQAIVTKYEPDPRTNGAISENDWIIFRYADILLMQAESQNELGNIQASIDLVNQVRLRVSAPALVGTDFNQSTLRDHIFMERKWELYYEGKGKQDMLRQGTLLDHIISVSLDAGSNPERYLLLPIPNSALSQNPGLEQNPGF